MAKDTTINDSTYVDSQCTIITNTSNVDALQNDVKPTKTEDVSQVYGNDTEVEPINMTVLDTTIFNNNFNITNLTNDSKFEDTTTTSNINIKDTKKILNDSQNIFNDTCSIINRIDDIAINSKDINNSIYNEDTKNQNTSFTLDDHFANLQIESNKADATNDSFDTHDTVYLSNIYNLIHSLNKKMETLQTKHVVQESFRYHYKNIYKYIMLNKTKDAKEYMKAICQDDVINENKYEKINKIKDLLGDVTKKVEDANESVKVLMKENKDTVSENIKNMKEFDYFVDKLQRLLNDNEKCDAKKDNEKCEGNKNYTLRTNNNDKCNDFVNDSLESIASGSEIKLNDLQNNKTRKYNKSKILKQVKMLVQQKESGTCDIKEENIKLQENINMLVKANVKLKKECALLSNELNVQKESSKKKQNTIEKQKKIINMLQTRFEKEDNNFTINVIEKKIEDLKYEIENESDYKKRCYKISELGDLEKRLHDFLMLQK